MSDEESFVILGTSPMSSLTSMQQREEVVSSGSNCSSFRSLQQSAREIIINAKEQSSLSQEQQRFALEDAALTPPVSIGEVSTKLPTENDNGTCANFDLKNSSNDSSRQSSIGAAKNSLAASFILGEVNADVLKTSVYSQFPSLCSMEACAEDVVKLQNFMSEYVELKNTLAKVNTTMKQFYNKTQQWKDDMQRMEQNYQQQMQDCQQQIAVLRNENLELKRDMNTKVEQMKIADELRQNEYDELVRVVSEKTSIIENMRAQLENLEQQQLASYEYIPKNVVDTKEKPDYVDRLEHERVVKGFERQLSELVAKNLDLSDVQTQYIDEINCLKVNLVAAEELIKNNQSTVNILQAENMEKSDTFKNFQIERDEIKEELALLRQQVDVYSRDFETERIARQNIAGEKDQLLHDLRALQLKNQELIEDAQKIYEAKQQCTSVPPASESLKASLPCGAKFDTNYRPIRNLPQPSSGAAQSTLYSCPICAKSFKELGVIQRHVNGCLDNTI